MKEVCLVPTYKREELLYCCLKRIRQFEPEIDIHVFPDRGTISAPRVRETIAEFKAHGHLVPDNNYYGNSANALNGLLWAYNAGYEHVLYVEDDVFVAPDFFQWHRQMHQEYDPMGIFGVMGWIFNRHAPIADGEMFVHWYYSIGTSFMRDKLKLIAKHASPIYYSDMQSYIRKNFPDSEINDPHVIAHHEHDGLLQRIMERDGSQVVTPGIAKCSHMGFGGYNRGWNSYENFFKGETDFSKRVQMIEDAYADPYWRLNVFGRDIVEREVGRHLPKREFRYRVSFDQWETEIVSEATRELLPHRLQSVPIPPHAKIELVLE